VTTARPHLFVLFACALAACGPDRRSNAPPPSGPKPAALPEPRSEPQDPKASSTMVRGVSVVKEAALAAPLDSRKLTGVVALLRGGADHVGCSAIDPCVTRYVPASTFKIPNSIIGLETGVIRDAEFVIPYSGVPASMPEWNRDHTLRSAIEVSSVPYYMELARRVGPQRMQQWLARLEYGNGAMGSKVDAFWLGEGPLLISPVEQVEFLRRLEKETLPIAPRTRDIVRDIIVHSRRGARTLRGKTGWANPGAKGEVGWFVGFVESEQEGATYVAVALLNPPKNADVRTLRKAIAEEALTAAGAW
jgi:beta-lactamase class D